MAAPIVRGIGKCSISVLYPSTKTNNKLTKTVLFVVVLSFSFFLFLFFLFLVFFLLFYLFFKTVFFCVALALLELALKTELTLNSQ